MRLGAAAVVVALASAVPGCGSDEEPVASAGACPVEEVGGDVIRVELTLQGDLDIGRAMALVDRFNRSQPDVAVEARVLDHEPPVDDLLRRSGEGDGPALAMVPQDHLASLAAAGAVVPVEPCMVADSFDTSPFLPVALTAGRMDGVQWGVPANLQTHVLVFDPDAFERAGLDPDAPPGTWDELAEAALALRSKAGFEHPVALRFVADALAAAGLPARRGEEAGFGGADGRAFATALAALGADGLVAPVDEHADLPPIGAGTAAIQDVDLGGIWGLADALAEGQAPGRVLDVAPWPGVDGPAAPVFASHLLVLGADVADRDRAGAWRFLRWLQRPENVADLTLVSDLLPTRADAVDDDAVTAHWKRLPLFRRAWEVVRRHGVAQPGEASFPGATGIVHEALAEIAFEGAPVSRLDAAADDVARAARAHDADPGAYVRCVHEGGGARCWE